MPENSNLKFIPCFDADVAGDSANTLAREKPFEVPHGRHFVHPLGSTIFHQSPPSPVLGIDFAMLGCCHDPVEFIPIRTAVLPLLGTELEALFR